MRSKGKIPECGTAKTREPDARAPVKPEPEATTPAEGAEPATPAAKTNDVESAPAFGNTRLSQEEENEVYIELAEFLNDRSFALLACKCLEYVSDKESLRVRFCNAKSLMMMLKIEEAANLFHDLFTNVDPELTDVITMYGHCKFIMNDHDAALEAYYRVIRILNLQGKKLTDSLVH